ncbi:MAG TPA: isoprenylcysteine carboxylmethyltransferase family protein [Reyranella sp.]|jgi:protein-S-isoprenylcysteine O-methyltransferase Ste14|nr:isoprenylcysteine carboxylmethyltransferase family protein [Reyranella sp.]
MFAAMAVLLFAIHWTFDWWQAWAFLAVYFACSIAISLWLASADPELMQRRMRGGPLAEKEPVQRLIMLIASAGFAGLIIVPALDRRFGWSHLSMAESLFGDLLLALGWLGIFVVFRENSYSSATIELAPDQKVISSGPYAFVRHPMYVAALVMLAGIPIALGSWWGLLALAAIFPALVWRIIDEERFLSRNLAGYAAYKEKVRHRLIPHLW